ncbi:HI1506-related protein [Mannheimia haemolytica]|nr:HI1506-related protein [Mannheimia haemolytica]
MDNTQLFSAVVQNKIKDGYRRAGISLAKGENVLPSITETQLKQLQADPRLVVTQTEQASLQNGGKGLSQHSPNDGIKSNLDGGVVPANLTVEQLKAKLTELGVEFKSDALKAELVAILTATLKPKEGE